MLEKYIPVLKQIYAMAKATDIEHGNTYNLSSYLNSLDFETIKVVQVIMYLGRDNEYNELADGYQRYANLRKDFDSQGWNTKEVEVNQIISKCPFAQYLKAGMRILGITLQ